MYYFEPSCNIISYKTINSGKQLGGAQDQNQLLELNRPVRKLKTTWRKYREKLKISVRNDQKTK